MWSQIGPKTFLLVRRAMVRLKPGSASVSPARPIHGTMFSSIALAMFSAMGRAQLGFRCHPLAGS